MKSKKSLWVMVVMILFFSGKVWGGEEKSDPPESIETKESVAVCDDLKEKMGFILEANSKISSEFKIVSDKELCVSVSEQCEYFYSMARNTQKEYRQSCDPNYKMAKGEKCDYSETPCAKNYYRSRSGVYAGNASSVKNDPFGVKILTLFMGE